jgi:hypothetical protein
MAFLVQRPVDFRTRKSQHFSSHPKAGKTDVPAQRQSGKVREGQFFVVFRPSY